MYQLSEASYKLLKGIELTELEGNISFDDDTLSINVSDFQLLLILIHEEIATNGLSADQNSVTANGRNLYALYDELISQKN